jgi:hypothetical protein
MSENQTTAIVTVTIEVNCRGNWGPDCSLAQIRSQATEEVRERITKLVSGLAVRIVSKPIVKTIINTGAVEP